MARSNTEELLPDMWISDRGIVLCNEYLEDQGIVVLVILRIMETELDYATMECKECIVESVCIAELLTQNIFLQHHNFVAP